MAAATGYLIRAVGWQMTFILEGIPSVLWAFVWIVVARDKPVEVPWLPEESSKHLAETLALEQSSLPQYANFRAALRVPGVLVLCFQYFCWSFGVYGLVIWIPAMIRSGSARGIEQIGLLSAAPFLLAVVLMLIVATFSDRVLRRTMFVWPFLILSGVALFCSFATAGHNFWLAYFCLVIAGGTMYAPYGPFLAIMPEMLPKQRGRRSDRAGEQLRGAGRICGIVARWMAAGRHGKRSLRIPGHVDPADRVRRDDLLPARA